MIYWMRWGDDDDDDDDDDDGMFLWFDMVIYVYTLPRMNVFLFFL